MAYDSKRELGSQSYINYDEEKLGEVLTKIANDEMSKHIFCYLHTFLRNFKFNISNISMCYTRFIQCQMLIAFISAFKEIRKIVNCRYYAGI